MKKTIIGIYFVMIFVISATQTVLGQGSVTFLSNVDQNSAGGSAVGSDSWLAAGFVTGNNAGGYVLNSVELGMTDASGNPSDLTVMIYSRANFLGISPGANLGTLDGAASPATAGNYNYTPSSTIALSPGTDYFIVLTSMAAVADGAYNWSYAGANNYNPAGGWVSFGGGWTSGNGSSWNAATSVLSQFAIDATAAPEPGAVGLLALGGLVFGWWRWKPRLV
jgi:hypothetical protein